MTHWNNSRIYCCLPPYKSVHRIHTVTIWSTVSMLPNNRIYNHLHISTHQYYDSLLVCYNVAAYWLTIRLLPNHVTEWNYFLRNWPFMRGIHRSPVNSPTKASDAEFWCFLWSASWLNGANNREAGDLRRHRAHYDVIVVFFKLGDHNVMIPHLHTAIQEYNDALCVHHLVISNDYTLTCFHAMVNWRPNIWRGAMAGD